MYNNYNNGYGAPNGYGMPGGYGAPNGYGVPNGYGMPGWYGAPMMSKEQFFKQPQYKGKRAAIVFGAVSMYLASFAELVIAISAESPEYILFMIFGIVMGIVIQVTKNMVCAIISSIFYGFFTLIYVVLDFVLLFAGMVTIFDLSAHNAIGTAGVVMMILLILEFFAAFLPMIGAIMASVATVKMNGDWEKYKVSFFRRGFY